MKHVNRFFWVIAGILMVCGLVLAGLGILNGAVNSGIFVDRTGIHVISRDDAAVVSELDLAAFGNISIDADSADVTFIQSDKYGMKVSYYSGPDSFSWSDENGALTLRLQSKNFFNIGFGWFIPGSKVAVYLPEGAQMDNVSVKSGSGNISLGGFSANDLTVNNSYGNVTLRDVTSGAMQVNMSSGNLNGTGIGGGSFDFKNRYGDAKFTSVNFRSMTAAMSSGDITFTDSTLDSLSAANSYGNITGSNLTTSGAGFDLSSGNIRLNGAFSGTTRITSQFGDVRLTTSLPRNTYTYNITTKYGDMVIDGVKAGTSGTVEQVGDAENDIVIASSSGDVTVNFNR